MSVVPSPVAGEQTGSASSGALTAYLQEYEVVWAEVHSRFENQRQAFNYLVAVLGGIVAAYAAARAGNVDLPVYVFLLAPLVIAPLGFIFFDNEFIIWSIVCYTRHHLRPRVQELVENAPVLEMECCRFKYLVSGSRDLHRLLSYGRWMLFLVPNWIAIGYAVAISPRWRQEQPIVNLLILDLILVLLLLLSMVQAARQQAAWRPSPVDGLPAGDTGGKRICKECGGVRVNSG